MPAPCQFSSLESCQKRFLWVHKEGDLAPHPAVGLVLKAGDVEKRALGFKSLDSGSYAQPEGKQQQQLRQQRGIDAFVPATDKRLWHKTVQITTNCEQQQHHFIIIINPLTARVVGAPQMILQPVFSISPRSPLPSGTCRTPGLSGGLFIPYIFIGFAFYMLTYCGNRVA